jgi:hypothetical protein
MSAESDNVIHQLAVGSRVAVAEIVERAHTSDDVSIVVSAALFTAGDHRGLMKRAATLAATTRDRQLVAIATAHLEGDADRVEDLARDHLSDHPDSVLAAWITSASNHAARARKDPP